MNKVIQEIFKDFTVDGKKIPVKFLHYQGHGEPYITWMQTDAYNSLSGDDDLIGYADLYDFDVYSKDDYFPIIESIKDLMKANGFTWQPSTTSADFYETDTGYYHKTLCFGSLRQEEQNG